MKKQAYETLFNMIRASLKESQAFGWATGYILGFKKLVLKKCESGMDISDLIWLYIAGPLQNLDAMRKDFTSTFKPYKGWYQIILGLLQPVRGIGNILKVIFHILFAVVSLLHSFCWLVLFIFCLLININSQNLPNIYSMRITVLIHFLSAISEVLDGIVGLIRGLTQILATPFIWLFQLPLRGILTAVNDGFLKIEDHPKIKSWIRQAFYMLEKKIINVRVTELPIDVINPDQEYVLQDKDYSYKFSANTETADITIEREKWTRHANGSSSYSCMNSYTTIMDQIHCKLELAAEKGQLTQIDTNELKKFLKKNLNLSHQVVRLAGKRNNSWYVDNTEGKATAIINKFTKNTQEYLKIFPYYWQLKLHGFLLFASHQLDRSKEEDNMNINVQDRTAFDKDILQVMAGVLLKL